MNIPLTRIPFPFPASSPSLLERLIISISGSSGCDRHPSELGLMFVFFTHTDLDHFEEDERKYSASNSFSLLGLCKVGLLHSE